MKKLDLSPISPGISMYVKGGTLQFLQLAYQEALSELTTSQIGVNYDTTKAYVLNGCINSGSGSNYIISAGSLFFNGEIYLVPAATFTITGSNVAEGIITITQYITDADPTDYTDGIQRNVHDIRQMVFSPALSGSGAVNFINLVNLAYKPVGAIGQTIEWLMPGGGSQNSLLPTYFDSGTLQGIHPLTLGWIIDDGGYVAAAYLASDSKFGTIGQTQGADAITLGAANIPVLQTANKFATTGGGTVLAYAQISVSSSALSTEPVNQGSANTPVSLIQRTKTKLKITRYA